LTSSLVQALVDAEISTFSDPSCLARLKRGLVEPYVELRPWDYGDPDDALPCWIFYVDHARDLAVAYCESGFGPRAPWGLLWLRAGPKNMGMDSGWFSRLEDLARDELE
jgi:hypothetical protein